MNVFDKLLGLEITEDLTETAWWTDTVFRGLEMDDSDEQGIGIEVAAAPTQLPSELE